ncbi:uncharacterized protein BDW43DRAFT_308128 [Aspergillus alliaceus]|uniref:uncharacterized protein n=1 Tax=Petromyces alliaceus TaxID=209559 RepID=UPI0012A4463F|nr:uncharacterized protein BDW43DRAFT_308128 [Aspergillus alliaceus]KAB8236449.1 hypothetical protein BDW43DRAFT_308128 [Aspergillus alliaceus]
MEKASILRRQTHNSGIHAKQDEVEIDCNNLITVNFSRPFRMLFTEPIVFLVTLYLSFIYGLMYALLGAYLVVFQGIHGINLRVGSLPFSGLIIGEFAGGVYTLLSQKAYTKKLIANNHVPVPERRLPPVIVGSIAFIVGLFWFGWTGWTKNIHWMAPTASGGVRRVRHLLHLPAMFELSDRFVSAVDSAASVFAANTILRSAVGACFPLFSCQMLINLAVRWAGTLLGCLAATMIPIPVGFIIWGPASRRKSKFAPTAVVFEEKSGQLTAVSVEMRRSE